MTLKTPWQTSRHASLRLLFCLLLIICVNSAAIVRASDLITNAIDVLELPAAKARLAIPVSVKGVVTAAEPSWSGRFFLQDSSGGVFVNNYKGVQPSVGDLVAVSGVTFPGGYAPCITKPHCTKLGTASLPAAKSVPIDRLMSGAEDSQRVEVSGIVRAAWLVNNRLRIELAAGGFRLHAYTPIPPNIKPASLMDAKVLLKGTVGTTYNAPLRHFIMVTLYVPQLKDFSILQPGPSNLFALPLTPLKDIAQYHWGSSPANLVRVKGVVTYQRQGMDLFIHDSTGGLEIESRLTEALSPGDIVEAVGFPAIKNFLPVLENAVFRKTGERRFVVKPNAVAAAELLKGLHQADLIMLKGRLIDRSIRRIGRSGENSYLQTILTLQTTNFTFTVERDNSKPNTSLSSIPIGSLLQVSGVCLLENDEGGKVTSIRMLLPSLNDVQILERPSWLTPQRLLISLATLFSVLLVAISWTVMLSKKNSVLKSLVCEKEIVQNELQKAHDQLEERVAERTAQLKVEMTARKESELQFRAVLTERTRLAQELHDTLEQSMTGIALQLDMVANLFEKNPKNSLHHLKLARNLMKQSQGYLRTSVMGLRNRAAEQFNLANALLINSRQIAGSAGIRVEVETTGEGNPLSEIVEENLLRIGQEAITNAVKHSEATLVKIELQFSPQQVVLQIKDDGKGFVPENRLGPEDGHFGLLGIIERGGRLGGHVLITSAPGMGACIRVEIPIHSRNANGALQQVTAGYEEMV
jgi:signal transduction histidine kinase